MRLLTFTLSYYLPLHYEITYLYTIMFLTSTLSYYLLLSNELLIAQNAADIWYLHRTLI